MIRSLRLENYKGFASFRIDFGQMSILVGPNNAGKTTCIDLLRSLAAMISHARRLTPDAVYRRDGVRQVRVYAFGPGQFGLEEENLRHEFNPATTRVRLAFSEGQALRVVWPEEQADEPGSFFYLSLPGERQPKSPTEVRSHFPTLGVVPQLSPIERVESVLTRRYLEQTLSTRLASRHFRNHLRLMTDPSNQHAFPAFSDFRDFAAEWLPEVQLDVVDIRQGTKAAEIDVFYREGRTRKELVWAGDGVQVFLQLLWHIYRLRGSSTIVLDEPDVYLHADLQRRLLRVLETLQSQVVLATHSAEIVTEAPPDAVTWMDRTTSSAVRAPASDTLDQLSKAIGSGFNLRLARVLRSRVAVFVEGMDTKVIRNLASTLGMPAFVNETTITMIPLNGSTNSRRLDGFKWIVENLLRSSIRGWVILDRDYRSDVEVQSLSAALTEAGLNVHIWRRHEIESYLLNPSAISRRSGAPTNMVHELLLNQSRAMKEEVLPGLTKYRFEENSRSAGGI